MIHQGIHQGIDDLLIDDSPTKNSDLAPKLLEGSRGYFPEASTRNDGMILSNSFRSNSSHESKMHNWLVVYLPL